MNLNELPLEHSLLTDRNIAIKLVGVGGAGSNAVDRLKMENLERLQLAVINTDYQALASSPVQDKVLIGMSVTRGLGAGGDPELGREAAEADREKISAVVKDCDLVFLVTGMGGGTGSGASPVVAEIAAETGALVIAFVTMPFSFEGGRRLKQAEEGLRALRQVCDAVIPLPNDVLLQEAAENETVLDSFARADEWIGRGVKSIWAMLFKTGLINLDFATLRQAFQHRGGPTRPFRDQAGQRRRQGPIGRIAGPQDALGGEDGDRGGLGLHRLMQQRRLPSPARPGQHAEQQQSGAERGIEEPWPAHHRAGPQQERAAREQGEQDRERAQDGKGHGRGLSLPSTCHRLLEGGVDLPQHRVD